MCSSGVISARAGVSFSGLFSSSRWRRLCGTSPPPSPPSCPAPSPRLYKWRRDRGRSSPEFSSSARTCSVSVQPARASRRFLTREPRPHRSSSACLRLWTRLDLYAPVRRPSAFPTLRPDMTRLLLSCLLLFVSTHTVSVHSPAPVSRPRPRPQTRAFTQSSSSAVTASEWKRRRARTFTCVQQ